MAGQQQQRDNVFLSLHTCLPLFVHCFSRPWLLILLSYWLCSSSISFFLQLFRATRGPDPVSNLEQCRFSMHLGQEKPLLPLSYLLSFHFLSLFIFLFTLPLHPPYLSLLTLVAEEPPPALLTVALPGLLAGPMQAARVTNALVAIAAFESHSAPVVGQLEEHWSVHSNYLMCPTN